MSGPTILFCAMLLDALFGEPVWLWRRAPHPAVLMGRLVSYLDKRLNTGSTRKRNGFLCAAVLVLLAGAVGWFLSEIGPLVEIVVTAILLAQRSLVDHVRAVADGLRVSLQNGRTAVSMIVSRETKDMQPDAVARSAIESAAENMSDGVIAPAFWFLIGGLPGILIYKAVNTADSMIGYMTPRHKEFGWAAARLDDLLNLIPARLTAGLFAVAGRVADFQGVRADAAKHKSPNAGWPEAALSRALDIALAGPRTYNGTLQSFPWVNATGRKSLSVVDIDDTIGMLWKSWGLMLVVIVCTGVLI